MSTAVLSFFFFFQAEDGIRDYKVTGVQTCALPICHVPPAVVLRGPGRDALRLPCFAVHAGFTLLPAFGLFTGMASLPPGPGLQRFAVGGGRVWAVPCGGGGM